MRYCRNAIITLIFILLPGAGHSREMLDNLVELGRGQAYYLKFIKVYDATLYGELHLGAEGILNEDISKCLHLEYAVDIGREDFIEAAETVLERQFSEPLLTEVRAEIDTLHKGYRDVEEGDSYTLCYDSSLGLTTLSLNGISLVEIRSPMFSKVYFGIWLGRDAPLDEKLRESLLAGFQKMDKNSGIL